MEMKPNLASTWLTIVAGLTGVSAWAYSTFEMKDHVREWKEVIIQRLDRIENKLDRAVDQSHGRDR